MTAVLLRKRLHKLLDWTTKLMRTSHPETVQQRAQCQPSTQSATTTGKFYNLWASISSSMKWDNSNNLLIRLKSAENSAENSSQYMSSLQVY